MTSLHQQVQAVLAPVTPGGAFYGADTLEMNETTVYPYLVWLRVSSNTNNTLGGPTDMQNTRVQVDLYCDQVADLDPSTSAVLAAMASGPFASIVQLDSKDEYVAEVRVWRRSFDFSVWSTN